MKSGVAVKLKPNMHSFADLKRFMAEAEQLTKSGTESLVRKTARQLIYSARDYTPVAPETSTWATLATGEDVELPDDRYYNGQRTSRPIRGRGQAQRGWLPAARQLGSVSSDSPPGHEDGGYIDRIRDWRNPSFTAWNNVEHITALEHGGAVPHLPGRTVDVVEPHHMVERAIHRAARVLEDQIQRHYRKLQKAWLSKRLA
jgi:hypothetical protein